MVISAHPASVNEAVISRPEIAFIEKPFAWREFAPPVMAELSAVGGRSCRTLLELIARSSSSLVIRAAGEAASLYTPAYLGELEIHSPFRFAFLSLQRKRLAQKSGLLARLFEAFLEGEDDEPAFPPLPSSLLPRL